MAEPQPFHWIFQDPHHEQAQAFMSLVRSLGPGFQARLQAAPRPEEQGVEAGIWVLRADFPDEETGRAFWLELHSRCLDLNLAMELTGEPAGAVWQPMPEGDTKSESSEIGEGKTGRLAGEGTWSAAGKSSMSAEMSAASRAASGQSAVSGSGMTLHRAQISNETLYDILRGDDPEMERNLEETRRWIEAASLPVVNLLSYLDLPLFLDYAAEHEDERDQNLFLHMLHTWTCYRHFGEVHAQLPPQLALAFIDPKYLRLNTTLFRAPAPALCVQFEPYSQEFHPAEGGPRQWVKEVYLTHLEPPTPADDRELTLMFITHDERGNYGFVPLEVPLSLPAVGQSIDAFFAPGLEDPDAGANSRDLQRLTTLAAVYCLYASAGDPRRYLASAEG